MAACVEAVFAQLAEDKDVPIEHGAPPELRVTDTVFWYGAQTDFASTGRELLLVTRFDVGGGDTVQGSPPWAGSPSCWWGPSRTGSAPS